MMSVLVGNACASGGGGGGAMLCGPTSIRYSNGYFDPQAAYFNSFGNQCGDQQYAGMMNAASNVIPFPSFARPVPVREPDELPWELSFASALAQTRVCMCVGALALAYVACGPLFILFHTGGGF